MKIRRIDRKIERDIVAALITSTEYVSRVRQALSPDCLKNAWCRTVAKWALDYYDEYAAAPGPAMQNIYDYQERQGLVEDTDSIGAFLLSLAEENAQAGAVNVEFLVSRTEEYLNRVALERMASGVEASLDTGNVEEARKIALDFRTIRIGESQATDGLVDEAELQSAFGETQQPLFKLPGAIGEMVNPELCRDKFIALQAPEKTGKTFWLLWLALRALRSRLKVVMFELEMTKNQVNKRMSISIAGVSDQARYCKNEHTPRKFSPDGEDVDCLPGMKILYEDMEDDEPLTWQRALECNKRFYERFRLQRDRHWRLVTAPARSLSIRQIDAELERLQKEEDFTPDVVLIDYMDILAPENPREQDRERINSSWVAAKALCNKWHIFLGSVTQSDSQAYEAEVQTRANFSEDHRKYAHTNGTLGLTQTSSDKRAGVAKLNWLVRREGDFNEKDVCFILQCLRKGRFCVDSTTPREYYGAGRKMKEKAADEGGGGRARGRRRREE